MRRKFRVPKEDQRFATKVAGVEYNAWDRVRAYPGMGESQETANGFRLKVDRLIYVGRVALLFPVDRMVRDIGDKL